MENRNGWNRVPKFDGTMEVKITRWSPAPEDVGGEKRREIQTFEVDYICPKCKKGNMRSTGICYYTNPVQYQNKCNACGHTDTMDKTYPYVDYTHKLNTTMKTKFDQTKEAFNKATEYCYLYGLNWREYIRPFFKNGIVVGYHVLDETKSTAIKTFNV